MFIEKEKKIPRLVTFFYSIQLVNIFNFYLKIAKNVV